MDMCRNCKQKPGVRPRGLCWHCYANLAIRHVYEPETECGRRTAQGHAKDQARRYPPPSVPTDAPPGSPEKIAVLAERVALRQVLFHRDDARGELS